ncbi:MAG: gamma-glutamyl-gamma-aminobutyrate hydrolase family protein [Actinomycetaceae bacterium]|nr:gamma-glutamyl-gamma-aminobutyrate hydrolase family protein [Arcanobacterium sp.]MDD7504628.1 gamma-glutamyl-gamma-aminobutyrate hydrolase family protein [Actinomycetaceae bacterium]MDY6143056.1 gamma-glutamyl-gamma-aminobutyrate hydrolase family protein [Arcanobacterium sp.]
MSAAVSHPFVMLLCRPAENIITSELTTIARLGGLELGRDLIPVRMLRASDEEIAALDLSQYSGVFISGSEYGFGDAAEQRTDAQNAMEARTVAVSQRIIDADIPAFGMCYGMHALAVAGGGTITHEYAEDIDAPQISVTNAGRQDAITAATPSPFQAFVGHHDAVGVMPDNSVVLASSDACPVQMFRIKNNIYGTQFHPEIDNEAMKIRTAYYSGAYFDPSTAQAIEDMRQSADVKGANELIASFVQRYAR